MSDADKPVAPENQPPGAPAQPPKTNAADTTGANAMWGGRFAAGPAAVMEAINASIDVDRRLWREDLDGSRAHARMLAATGIISNDDAEAIARGLDEIAAEIADGSFPFRAELEDIHMNVEARLRELIGEPAGRLHTARSRNDQVATDFRLWVRARCDDAAASISALQAALARKAEAHADAAMPGFTHLQTAQPVTFGHHCLSYVELLERDRGRFLDARRRMNECPLGAAALAGTSFPIDRDMTAAELGFDRPTANSLDSVSARDFALEALAAASIAAVGLSRLGEEIVMWTSPHFGFAALTDAFSTGSSIMPQKRNPDAAELCRAKVGRILGAFQAMSVVMKGLPLAYAKDMQEDKATTFAAFDDFALAVAAMAGMVDDLRMDEMAMARAAGFGHATATDLADWIVRELGLAFREAHEITGRIVALADEKSVALDALGLADMQRIEPRLTAPALQALSVAASVASRRSYGGASPDNVRREAARWREILADRAKVRTP